MAWCQAPALGDILVVGLFKDKAVVEIDGRRRVLSVGEVSPEGVRLVAADSERAVLEVDGKRATYRLGTRISTRLSRPEQAMVQVWRNPSGMYQTTGSINGLPVSFLVDTGASLVAMNANEAKRLGIDYRVVGTPATVSTASGVARAWRVKLKTVQVGGIRLRNVDTMVIDGPYPREVLLGMSFLGRLEIENRGQAMVLRQKY